jgi:hypothetical protein
MAHSAPRAEKTRATRPAVDQRVEGRSLCEGSPTSIEWHTQHPAPRRREPLGQQYINVSREEGFAKALQRRLERSATEVSIVAWPYSDPSIFCYPRRSDGRKKGDRPRRQVGSGISRKTGANTYLHMLHTYFLAISELSTRRARHRRNVAGTSFFKSSALHFSCCHEVRFRKQHAAGRI